MRRVGWAAAVATTIVLAMAAPGARAELDLLSTFEGRYTFAGGRAERTRLDEAIDEVADRLNLFIREIARGELRRAIRPEPRIQVAVVARDRVRMSLGDWGPLEVTLDNQERHVRGPDGSDTRLRGAVDRGRIVLVQESSRGRRTNWLSLGPDGRWLYLQVQIGADQLPEDIRYTLSYRRR
ncbi:MAG: hypothetical protein H6719_33525 [Sandaracinaceae bacterium]|nr:hypothetical protein [Sandaracinaceae bacterium]